MVKDALQSLMKKKRPVYLKEHPTEENNFYARSLEVELSFFSRLPKRCILGFGGGDHRYV